MLGPDHPLGVLARRMLPKGDVPFQDLTDEMLRANYRYLQLAEAADAERVRLLGEAAKDAVERCGRQHTQRRRTHRRSDKGT